jgi:hypothetical protein
LKTLERVKGIEPSSSAWKAVAVSMISEVIPDNRYQKYPSGINQKLPRREQANGPMSDAIHLPAFQNISTIGRWGGPEGGGEKAGGGRRPEYRRGCGGECVAGKSAAKKHLGRLVPPLRAHFSVGQLQALFSSLVLFGVHLNGFYHQQLRDHLAKLQGLLASRMHRCEFCNALLISTSKCRVSQ